MIQLPEITKKAWGEERLIYNGSEYCGKLLCFNEGTTGSLHYHLKKQESWYLQSGGIELTTINKEGERTTVKMYAGETVTITRGLPHKVKAIMESVIFEVSTTHDDNDTYRIESAMQ